jgi:hypothetical protein
MPTARKGLLTMLAAPVTPPVQCTFGNAEIAGSLCQRLVARLGQLHRFQFELLRKRSLSSCAWSFPFMEDVPFFKFTFSISLGQDQRHLLPGWWLMLLVVQGNRGTARGVMPLRVEEPAPPAWLVWRMGLLTLALLVSVVWEHNRHETLNGCTCVREGGMADSLW